jgi:hypothetical protein
MTLTVRASSYFTVPLSANLLSVSSAFVTADTSLLKNVNVSLTLDSRTASSFELSAVRTRLLVARPVSIFLAACKCYGWKSISHST